MYNTQSIRQLEKFKVHTKSENAHIYYSMTALKPIVFLYPVNER